MTRPPRPRTLIFCVSEMAPDLVAQWAGDLPTINRLAQAGVNGRTRYAAPFYLTPQMWATINTGTTPGHHGIFDYRQRFEDGAFRETHGGDVAGRPWWSVLEEAGFAAGVINLPLTYPPDMARGFMISGQDAPGSHPSIMTPASLYDELSAAFGRYHLKDVFPGGQERSEYVALLAAELARQADVYEWIAGRKDWDCLVLYTSGVAMAQHYYWADMAQGSALADVIRETFIATDRMLARVLRAAGDGLLDVCVMSECGAGPLRYGVNLNAALRDAGFLAYQGTGALPAASRKSERRLLSAIRTLAQRHLPKQLFYAANRSAIRGWILERLSTQGIDWSRTTAFHRGKGEGNIYLNLKGRDPEGIVLPEDRDSVIDALTTMLLGLATPDGEHPVAAVHRREDLYAGPLVERAPDLVIEWRDAAFMPNEKDHENDPLFGPRWREYMGWPTTGSHRPEGVFIAAGPSIAQRDTIAPVSLTQLAPLWLALHGVAAPAGMEGELRTDILTAT